MDDKNLDKLFRDKFKAFREIPDEKVWTAIDRSLDKKRKKRVIPLWWSLGGAAAILAIALLVFPPSDDGLIETPTVTDTERTDAEGRDRMDADRTNQDDTNAIEEDGSDSNSPRGTSSEMQGRDDVNQGQDYGNQDLKNGNNRQSTENQRDEAVEQSQESRNRLREDKSSREENRKRQQKNQKQRLEKRLQISTPMEEAVAKSSKNGDLKNTEEKDRLNTPNPAGLTGTSEIGNTDTEDASRKKNESGQDNIRKDNLNQYSNESQLTSNEKTDGNRKTLGNRIPKNNQSKGTVDKKRDALAESGNKRTKDSIARPEIDSKSDAGMAANDKGVDESSEDDNKKSVLEAFDEQAEEEELAETSRSRWSAGPSLAPVYFNAIGEGSPIDPGFATNGKSGNTNFSYGLSVAYEVTEKLSVRSGIHKIDYGYDTNNVPFSSTLGAFASGGLENIDSSGGSNNLAVSDVATESESPNSLATEFSSLNSIREGTVAQQFGYLEIPLEVDYALVDNKFGIHLVGGISSLFLIDNSVTLNSEDLSTGIGEASNLNDLNFSTNIGFGVNYKFTPAIRLNVEPIFKYQLKTFSNTSGDFRPYSIGVYSGLNFRF